MRGAIRCARSWRRTGSPTAISLSPPRGPRHPRRASRPGASRWCESTKKSRTQWHRAPRTSCWDSSTLFKPNRRELEQAMGATLDLAHPDALPTSLDKLGVDNLLLTLGAEGMVLVTKDRQLTRIPTMAREVFDVSGAGDTVTAWVGTALAAGASVREGAQVANYAAGVEVGKSGVATVSPREVLAMHEAHYDQLGKLRRGGLL